MEIGLTHFEYQYLCHAPFLTDDLRKTLFASETHDDMFLLKISQDQADELRDLCGEQLQLVGFDAKYNPTSEGKLLESLIDKFYAG
ncbi:MAG: hypothetical protein ACHQT8_03465 [Chlamydiales bacterium]